MQFAFSSNAFKQTTLEAAIDVIAAIGYAGLEIMADVPHAYPPQMPTDRILTIKKQLTARGLAISNVNAFTLFAIGDTYHPTWIEDDEEKIAQRIEHTINVIRMTAALGGKTISLQPGGPQDHLTRAEALRRYREGLEAVLPLAKELGITLMIEPEPGLLIQYSHECVEFLREINHPNLRMNCDLGHFYCVEEDPATVVRQCAPYIAHIHLEDIREDRVHQHRVPGTGAMNFDEIFKAIRDIHYNGWVTVELYPYESTAEKVAREAYAFLKKYM